MKFQKELTMIIPSCLTILFINILLSTTSANTNVKYDELWNIINGNDYNRRIQSYKQCPIADKNRRNLSSKSKKSSSKSKKSSSNKSSKSSKKSSSSSSKSSKKSSSSSSKSSKKSWSSSSESSKTSKYSSKPYTVEYKFKTETDLIGNQNLNRVMNDNEIKRFECIVREYLEESWEDICIQSDPQVIEWVVEKQTLVYDDLYADFIFDIITQSQFSYPRKLTSNRKLQTQSPRVVTNNRGSGTYRAPPPLDGSKIIEESVVSSPSRRRLDSKKSSKDSSKSSKLKNSSSSQKSSSSTSSSSSSKSSKSSKNTGSSDYSDSYSDRTKSLTSTSKIFTSDNSDELLQRLRESDSYFDDVVAIVTRVTMYEERARSSLHEHKKLDLSVCDALV